MSQAVARLAPALVGRAPLLGPVLGLTLPDSDLTATFDGELRKTSLEDLLGRLLSAVADEAAGVALVVEDAHWLDPLSRDLLESLSRTIARAPVLLLVTTRPDGSALAGLPLGRGSHVTDLVLEPLGPEASAALVRERHQALAGRAPAPEVLGTIVSRAEGNAFYLEQLVDYVLAHADRADGSVDPDALELPQPAQPGAQPDRRPGGGPAAGRRRGQRHRPGLPLPAGRRGVPRPRARAGRSTATWSPSPRPG